MKKFLFVFFCIAIIQFVSCKNDDSLKSDLKINLSAPSGVLIAKNLEELTQIVASTISPEKTINSSSLKILSINYLPVKNGFVAMIDYLFEENKSNLAYFDLPRDVEYTASTLKSVNVSGNIQLQKVTVSCAGNCDCKVEGTIKPDGTITFGCSCSDCAATIIYP